MEEGHLVMGDVRDPAIKLFGHTIHSFPNSLPQKDADEDARQEEVESQRTDFAETVGDPDCLSYSNNDDGEQAPTDQEEVQTTTDVPAQEKAEKKPDQICPCPRCNSLNTKFCYYNNYNVNQPRHFCKNCHRYWTAGGTMRNVPVGSGRRKSKHATSHYHHMVMSPNEIPNGITPSSQVSHHQVLSSSRLSVPLGRPLNDGSTVLKFGPDGPLCESMAAVLNLVEHNGTIDNSSSTICGQSGEEASCRSSMPSAACVDKDLPNNTGQMESEPGPGICTQQTPPPPVPFYTGPPLPVAWGPVWNGVAVMAAVQCRSDPSCGNDATNSHPLPWRIPQMMAPAALYAPSVPYPLDPAPSSYWTGCIPGWTGGPWSLPWFPSGSGVSPSSSGNNGCSGSGGSPILGKHSRDSNLPTEEKLEKCLWIPKTLRIDDPDEAAKSSIWAALGSKPDHKEPVIKGGIFKAFRSDIEGQECASGSSQLLQANPAALSRSRAFQENIK